MLVERLVKLTTISLRNQTHEPLLSQRPGTCFRLYTEKSFLGRETVQKPEIQRAELQSLFLQLVAIGQNPFEFDFIDAPDREASEYECA